VVDVRSGADLLPVQVAPIEAPIAHELADAVVLVKHVRRQCEGGGVGPVQACEDAVVRVYALERVARARRHLATSPQQRERVTNKP